MRPASWNITLSTGSSEPVFSGGGRTRALTIKRSAQARRMRLAVDPRDGSVRLTLPRRAGLKQAIAWAESQRGWIEAALEALPAPQVFGLGASFPFDGQMLTLAWTPGPRAVRIEGDAMLVGGPESMATGRALRWMRDEGQRRLEAETRIFAARAGVTIGRVRVGDPRTRWGSCSGSGDIAYSWRLILMPPAVREAIVAHEVVHRLHMHHGPEFHAAVKNLLGREPKAERAWLRANGSGIHGVGRVD
jgi:predicted metal-dependent hydrolase